jgi:hypothetical protein
MEVAAGAKRMEVLRKQCAQKAQESARKEQESARKWN